MGSVVWYYKKNKADLHNVGFTIKTAGLCTHHHAIISAKAKFHFTSWDI